MLKIKTKDGDIKPLVLNTAQITFAEKVFADIMAGKLVRIIILKARQMGFSTVTEAIIYYLTSLQAAKNAFIVAQDSHASGNLYDMFRLYYENVPEIIKPMSKRNNTKRFTFENPSTRPHEQRREPGLKSKITVQSAESRVLARSETIHYLHASEVAFWPASKKKKHMLSMFAALSKEAGTVGVIESTANGMDDFKKMWEAATEGENDFTPMFFAWFEMPDYRKPVPDDFELTEEERELKKKYSLDNEQLQWRRFTIRNDCNGDSRTFRQEYPSEPMEAFLLSGEGIFDNEYIQKLLDALGKPGPGERYEIDHIKGNVIRADSGELRVFKLPEEGKRYIIGADTAKGKEGGDYDVAYVLEERTGETCAVIRGHWDTDLYGKKLDRLGRFYNIALLGVENNNTGESVLNTLFNTCKYPLLYMWKKGDLGWNTNQATRPVMVSDFKEAIRDQLYPIHCRLLYKECLTFIDKNGKAEADSGCNDDCIMAYSIALQLRQVAGKWFEWYDKKQKQKQEDTDEGVGWI
ncbi:DNA packaging protein [Paenibacillus sp. JX-17]|uniref:DNA packaging protein n=2 Tax=Paenibacillus lacisoli TaxID=3064525 RepID=A0ABT9CHU9_9BACL|nr:DNA packaging protein [Paenibacillus sp. JX-17]